MIKAVYRYMEFKFRQPARTSRGTLYTKKVYFLILFDDKTPSIKGIGECSVFPGLSMDDTDGFQRKLDEIVDLINRGWFNLKAPIYIYPSINFAIETALRDLDQQGSKVFYPSEFTEGKDSIRINGLIWMGDADEMKQQIDMKLKQGFTCLKLKVGSLSIEEEIKILASIRKNFSISDLEIRLDANGAYQPEEALEILYRLSDFGIHSVEQPILPSQLEEMAALCETSPIPVALDEELIGKHPKENKVQLLKIINPKFIVLKPGLLGGISACEEWIDIANEMNIGWWVTSSLETNIGLNVIAQWAYKLANPMAQGLGTGNLFENNIDSPLAVTGEKLYYFPNKKWDLSFF
jgi:O-succinylbenzoate synthase